MHLAQRYYKEAMNWLPYNEGQWNMKYSGPSDAASIMMFASDVDKNPRVQDFPLVTTGGRRIYIGGNPDPGKAGISNLDIQRVLELYPIQSVGSRAAPEGAPSTPGNSDSMPEDSHWSTGQSPGKAVTKRWWSVKEDYLAEDNKPRAWPGSGDGSRIVTYCFQDQRAWDNLGPLFTRALDKWDVAMRVSSLEFAPDTACRQVPCLCTTPNVADTSLHIMQAQEGVQMSLAVSTMGYRNHNIPVQAGMPRHYVLWPANTNLFGSPAQGILMMAHELGERTRPKASKEGGRR